MGDSRRRSGGRCDVGSDRLAVGLRDRSRADVPRGFSRIALPAVGALTATGVTVVMTAEVLQGQSDVRFTSEKVSFITDDIVAQRYVEIDGELRTVVAVVKMRGSQHSREFRFYEITPAGAVVGEALTNYHGIITGVPDRTS